MTKVISFVQQQEEQSGIRMLMNRIGGVDLVMFRVTGYKIRLLLPRQRKDKEDERSALLHSHEVSEF